MIANELRIGNLVAYGVHPVPIKSIHTESVLKKEVHVYVELNENLNHYCIDVLEVKPIPLTEQWLLKLGFERDNQGNWKLKSGYHWIEIYSYHVYINGQQVVLIDYVHQLQNIWFALTGKELTYGGNK
jgi:hypothetical protein